MIENIGNGRYEGRYKLQTYIFFELDELPVYSLEIV